MAHVLDGGLAGLPLEVTFDGSTREVAGRRVSGAGAMLWGPACQDGSTAVLARATVALPDVQLPSVAEAWGCRVGLELMMGCDPSLRACRVVGDNLAVVRYCAGHGCLRRPEVQAVLGDVLVRAASCGWHLAWMVVSRRLNQAADAAAAQGSLGAAELAARGSFAPLVNIWRPDTRDADGHPSGALASPAEDTGDAGVGGGRSRQGAAGPAAFHGRP